MCGAALCENCYLGIFAVSARKCKYRNGRAMAASINIKQQMAYERNDCNKSRSGNIGGWRGAAGVTASMAAKINSAAALWRQKWRGRGKYRSMCNGGETCWRGGYLRGYEGNNNLATIPCNISIKRGENASVSNIYILKYRRNTNHYARRCRCSCTRHNAMRCRWLATPTLSSCQAVPYGTVWAGSVLPRLLPLLPPTPAACLQPLVCRGAAAPSPAC
jgi:hypothetical protein